MKERTVDMLIGTGLIAVAATAAITCSMLQGRDRTRLAHLEQQECVYSCRAHCNLYRQARESAWSDRYSCVCLCRRDGKLPSPVATPSAVAPPVQTVQHTALPVVAPELRWTADEERRFSQENDYWLRVYMRREDKRIKKLQTKRRARPRVNASEAVDPFDDPTLGCGKPQCDP